MTAISQVISEELRAAPEDFFAKFDSDPLAGASIGQVHAATLANGTLLVVKLRRPGVVARIEAGLEFLQNLAARSSRRWDAAADYDLTGMAAEFAPTLRAELDYLQEGRNSERSAENFGSDPRVHIPRVFRATTTSRVLTPERINGAKVNELKDLDGAAIQGKCHGCFL